MPINTAAVIELSEDERSQLESWARRRTSAHALARRSRIVLAAEGLKNVEIAERLGVHRAMVTKRGARGLRGIEWMAWWTSLVRAGRGR